MGLHTLTSGCTQRHTPHMWECLNSLFLRREETHMHAPLGAGASPCLFAPVGLPAGGWSSRRQPVASFVHGPPQLPGMTGLYSATFPVTFLWIRPCKKGRDLKFNITARVLQNPSIFTRHGLSLPGS